MLTHPSERILIAECKKHDLLRNQAAYVLATAKHETGNFRWLREIWGPTKAQIRYEGRKDLGNTQPGDGKAFMGRGFVHITGRRNYKDWSQRLGVSLINDPEKAEELDIAARIIVEGMKLGTFTGKKLSDYITLQKSDFFNARRIVNGKDKAALIAQYAKQYDEELKADGYGVKDIKPIPQPQAKPTVYKSLAESKELLGGVTLFLGALGKFFDQIDGNTLLIIVAAAAFGFIANRLYARWKGER